MRTPSWRRSRQPPATTCWSNSDRPGDRIELDQLVLDGVPGCGAPRFHAQLRINRSKVGVDGPSADTEFLGELPVRPAAGDEPEDFDLSRGQAVCPRTPRHGEVSDGCTRTL